MDNYVYEMDGKLYLNLTNRCSNRCEFCIRTNSDTLLGYDMWLKREPTFEDVKLAIDRFDKPYTEAVFCGYGEPTYAFDVLVKVGKYLRELGKHVRLNTNGQGRLINDRDIIPELLECVDEVSVSLNEAERGAYQNICHPRFGMFTHDEVIDFAKACKAAGLTVRFTVVDTIPNDSIRKCRKVASSAGIPLTVRHHITNNDDYS